MYIILYYDIQIYMQHSLSGYIYIYIYYSRGYICIFMYIYHCLLAYHLETLGVFYWVIQTCIKHSLSVVYIYVPFSRLYIYSCICLIIYIICLLFYHPDTRGSESHLSLTRSLPRFLLLPFSHDLSLSFLPMHSRALSHT